jgi:plastocyanin
LELYDMTQTDAAHRLPARHMLISAVLTVALAACSSGAGSTPSSTAASTPSVSASQSAADSQSAAASASQAGTAENTVMLMGFAFEPTTLTVPAGTTVTFVNMDPTEHTVTNGKDGTKADAAKFDEKVDSGASVEITFDTPGTFDVTCTIHPSMNMTVTVQ